MMLNQIVETVKESIDQAIAAEAETKQREKRIEEYIAKLKLSQNLDMATTNNTTSQGKNTWSKDILKDIL